MSRRNLDPFLDHTDGLDQAINPYLAEIRESKKSSHLPLLAGPDLKDCLGQWKKKIAGYHREDESTFGQLVVEIGCHCGKTLVEMAANHPKIGFVGLDITFKRVVTTARRVRDLGLKNVLSVLADAKFLTSLFAPSELDGIIAFFPDPWPKKSQAKNRLFSPQFCIEMKSILRDGGFFWFRTDQMSYFEAVKQSASEAGFGLAAQSPLKEPQKTVFQIMSLQKGLPTWEASWVKPPK